MKLRNLTLIAGLLVVACFTNAVFALGMGELKLNSSLNEPLDAEIKLLNTGDLSELEMLVGLGSREDFKAAGVERLFMLTDLRFKVDMSSPGNPILRVTSRKPIREPYLNFLLELQWPSGRLLREYTLLLDLPVYATERASAKKIKAASASPQPKPQQQAPAASSSRASSSTATSRRSSSPSTSPAPLNTNGGEYRVAPGDTAWGIARKIKPDDASIMQSLAAIKQSNPNAFINGDINLLKKGAVLRIPSSADISQLSPQQVKEQIDFSPESAIADKMSTQSQLDGTALTSAASSVPVDGGGRLKLAVPNDSASGGSSANPSGGTSGTAGGSARGTEKLENDFAIFQEELDKTQRENAELKDRLAKMEEQIATMGRLVEINDDSLRGAQQVASQVQQADQEGNSQEIGASEVAASQEEDSEADVETAVASGLDKNDLNKDELDKEQSDKSSAKDGSDKTKPETGKDSSVDKAADKDGGFNWQYWIDLLLYPLIGLLAILLAVILFFTNRKQDEEPREELSLQTLVEKESTDEDELEEILDEEDKEVLEAAAPELDEQELKHLEELELTEDEDVDPIGEADIYLSLGNYNQAESVLLEAINEAPSDAALRLKLLEVYVGSNELDKFDAQYEQFSSLDDAETMARADSLRAELAPETVVDLGADLESDDMDQMGEASGSDFDLDLDLGNIDLEDVDPESLDLESRDPENVDSEDKDLDTLDSKVADADISDLDSSALDSTDIDSSVVDNSSVDDSDLENIDLDTLASDIDAEMESIDLEGGDDEVVSLDLDSQSDDLSETVSDTTLEAPLETTAEPISEAAVATEVVSDDFDDFDDDLDILAGEDECSTKLELAQAYLDMGDPESAKDILDEVVSQGDDSQQEQARKLLESVT